MNAADARRFLTDLLTDYHLDRWRGLCTITDLEGDPDDSTTGAAEVAAYLERTDLAPVVARVFDVGPDGEHTLHEWATLSQIAAVAEQHPEPISPVPTPAALPCPQWCDRPAGHPFEQYAETTRRDHVHRFGDRGVCVTLEQIERSVDPTTGLTDLGIDPAATTIRVQYGPGQIGYLTAAGARRMAAQLNAAADLHDLDAST